MQSSNDSAVLKALNDDQLLAALLRAVNLERAAQGQVLEHLAEVDGRGLFRREGYSSMFAYCTKELNFSESSAYHRICAARAARRFPLALELVRSGELHLSGLTALAPRLNQDNHRELLHKARNKSKQQISELLADRRPKPDAPASVRLLRSMVPTHLGPIADPYTGPARMGASHSGPSQKPEPLGQDRFKIQFTAGRGMYEKLREAQALLSHAIPEGNLEQIFDRALTLLVEDVKRKRFARTRKPPSEGGSPAPAPAPAPAREGGSAGEDPSTTGSDSDRPARASAKRYIPAHIRRAVYERDRGRCTFLSWNGTRCDERHFLQLHHVEPWARSKTHSEDGIVLICHAHNQYMAAREFGALYIEQRRRGPNGESVVKAPRGSEGGDSGGRDPP